jgi:chromosome partitioning protein
MEPKLLLEDISKLLHQSKRKLKKQIKEKSSYHTCGGKLYLTHEDSASFLDFLNFKGQVVAFHLIKGGVGKTTLTQSIATRVSLYGAKVLCIDLDQQSNLSQAFGKHHENAPNMLDIITKNISINDAIINVCPGIDLIKSSLTNAKLDQAILANFHQMDLLFSDLIAPIKSSYDFIFFDCPPTLGASVQSALLASDTVILPINPDLFSIEGLKICVDEVEKLSEAYNKTISPKILINKFDNRTILSHEISQFLFESDYFQDLVFPTIVHNNQDFANKLSRGVSIYDSPSQKKSAKEIDDIVINLMELRLCQTKNK